MEKAPRRPVAGAGGGEVCPSCESWALKATASRGTYFLTGLAFERDQPNSTRSSLECEDTGALLVLACVPLSEAGALLTSFSAHLPGLCHKRQDPHHTAE